MIHSFRASRTLAVLGLFLAAVAPASAQLVTGFESPFTTGTINGQQGWTVSTVGGVPTVSNNISTANPQSGTQALRITDSAAVANGTTTGVFSPATGFTGSTATITTISLAITGVVPGATTGGADYDVILQSPTQALLTARVNFSFLGNINIVDDTDGNGSFDAFVNTGVSWTPGAYSTLSILVDAPNNLRQYRYNGALIYTGAVTAVAGTVVEQVVLISDNFQVAGEAADFDNLSVVAVPAAVVPESGSVALMLAGLGIAGCVVRRRK